MMVPANMSHNFAKLKISHYRIWKRSNSASIVSGIAQYDLCCWATIIAI